MHEQNEGQILVHMVQSWLTDFSHIKSLDEIDVLLVLVFLTINIAKSNQDKKVQYHLDVFS